MKLPNAEKAWIPEAKLRQYLFSPVHPVGGSKARYFHAVGFKQEQAHVLEQALLEVARSCDVVETETTIHGTKYVVEGLVHTPTSANIRVRTVWIIEHNETFPRLVTAYPL